MTICARHKFGWLVLLVVIFCLPMGLAAAPKSSLWVRCGAPCKGKKLHRMSHRQIDELLSHLHKRFPQYGQRLQLLAELFLGAKYSYGPLGEGPKGRWDRDPIFRLDRLDCVTYVETVMALALSRTVKEARKRLQQIRYKRGKIGYSTRLHFTAAQWLVENEKAGYTRVITQKVGGSYARKLVKRIRPSVWKSRRWRRWARRLPAQMRPSSYQLWYVPLAHIPKLVARLPSIGWMGEVYNRRGSPVAVRHVGFFVRKKGKMYFRHANRPKVAEVSLIQYARWRARQSRRRKKLKQRRIQIIGFSFAAFPRPGRVRPGRTRPGRTRPQPKKKPRP